MMTDRREEDMTPQEVGIGLGIVTGIASVVGWLNNKIEKTDSHRGEEMAELTKALADSDRNIASNYMTKDETMKMYSLMNESQDFRLSNLEKVMTEVRDANKEQFNRIFVKLDSLR